MTDYRYNYANTANPNRANAPQEDLWSFSQINTLPGPSGTVILHNPRSDARMVITADVAQALSFCHPFRTIGEHASAISSAVGALKGQEVGVAQTLKSIADAGLLHSARLTLNELISGEAPDTTSVNANAPLRLFILTCDRPMALERLLASIQAKPLSPCVNGLWVIDDSRNPANELENQRLSAEANSRGSLSVQHFGTRERAELIQQLATHCPKTESSINFALNRDRWPGQPTHGVARNLAQLLSVGYRAIIFDDDMLCEAVAPPMTAKPLRFGTITQREAVLYGSSEELNRHKMVLETSPITMMANHLGNTFAGLAHTSQSFRDLRSLAGVEGQLALRFMPSSQVLLAQTGSWGDPGTGGGNWLFFLPKASRQKLLESGDNLEALIAARASWVGFKGPTLTAYGAMSGMTGLDNRELLPPYLPASRSEDIMFAIMLQRIHPRSMVWNSEWSVPHSPVDSRADRADLRPITAEAGIANLADWLGREPKDQWGLPPERLLTGLADQVRRLATMSPQELNKLVSLEVLSKQSNLLDRTAELLRELPTISESPNRIRWQSFLEATREGLVTAVQTAKPAPLEAISGPNGFNEVAILGQELADLLDAWPTLREVARNLYP